MYRAAIARPVSTIVASLSLAALGLFFHVPVEIDLRVDALDDALPVALDDDLGRLPIGDEGPVEDDASARTGDDDDLFEGRAQRSMHARDRSAGELEQGIRGFVHARCAELRERLRATL